MEFSSRCLSREKGDCEMRQFYSLHTYIQKLGKGRMYAGLLILQETLPKPASHRNYANIPFVMHNLFWFCSHEEICPPLLKKKSFFWLDVGTVDHTLCSPRDHNVGSLLNTRLRLLGCSIHTACFWPLVMLELCNSQKAGGRGRWISSKAWHCKRA